MCLQYVEVLLLDHTKYLMLDYRARSASLLFGCPITEMDLSTWHSPRAICAATPVRHGTSAGFRNIAANAGKQLDPLQHQDASALQVPDICISILSWLAPPHIQTVPNSFVFHRQECRQRMVAKRAESLQFDGGIGD